MHSFTIRTERILMNTDVKREGQCQCIFNCMHAHSLSHLLNCSLTPSKVAPTPVSIRSVNVATPCLTTTVLFPNNTRDRVSVVVLVTVHSGIGCRNAVTVPVWYVPHPPAIRSFISETKSLESERSAARPMLWSARAHFAVA